MNAPTSSSSENDQVAWDLLVQFAAFLARQYELPLLEMHGVRRPKRMTAPPGVKIVGGRRGTNRPRAVRFFRLDGENFAPDLARAIKPLIQSVNDGMPTLVVTPPNDFVRNPAELAELFLEFGVQPAFQGWTPGEQPNLLTVFDARALPAPPPPDHFRVVALMRVFNEVDILERTLRYLIDQGIDVYLLDGWSTDGSYEVMLEHLGRGVIGVERFPCEGPARFHTQIALLRRMEYVASTIPADWFVYQDTDERRVSPWTGIGLRDGLHRVDQQGFNAIDHTVIEFPPTAAGGEAAGSDPFEQLDRFVFTAEPSHFVQCKAWRAQPARVNLADTAGHDVAFPGRRVFPYKFLLRHYPIRSQAHGERKLLAERQARLNPFEAARNWSTHYRAARTDANHVVAAPGLERYDEAEFNERYCVERLSGCGSAIARWRVLGYPAPCLEQDSVTLPWSGATLWAEAVHPPSLDPMQPGLGSVKICWNTGDRSYGSIFVRAGQPAETLFTTGPSGEGLADWIAPDVPYRFRLYTDPNRSALHAELTLCWRSGLSVG